MDEIELIENDLKTIGMLGMGRHPCGDGKGFLFIENNEDRFWLLWLMDEDHHYRLKYGAPISVEFCKNGAINVITHAIYSAFYEKNTKKREYAITSIREKLTDCLIIKVMSGQELFNPNVENPPNPPDRNYRAY